LSAGVERGTWEPCVGVEGRIRSGVLVVLVLQFPSWRGDADTALKGSSPKLLSSFFSPWMPPSSTTRGCCLPLTISLSFLASRHPADMQHLLGGALSADARRGPRSGVAMEGGVLLVKSPSRPERRTSPSPHDRLSSARRIPCVMPCTSAHHGASHHQTIGGARSDIHCHTDRYD
jgi:hypothetical protein